MNLKFNSRIIPFLLCGTLFIPAKVLLAAPPKAPASDAKAKAAPAPPKVVLSEEEIAEQALRNKDAMAALASFKGDNLVKRINEAPPKPTKKEIELGEKATKQLEKDKSIKVLDPKKDAKNKALYERLNKIASKLGEASGRPGIKYSVKIIESKDLNAFTLPNGSIYFYSALLDTLYSDDEIAAVMAHEIAHNVCMHALRGQSKSRKLSLLNLAVLLAALSGGGQDAGKAVMFSQYLSVGLMNEYSEEYESEADIVGVSEMIKAGYNPSAMVTVMQRFAVEENRHPKLQMGIFQDHPEPTNRANAITTAIKAAGMEYNPREVNGVTGAEVVSNKDNTTIEFRQSVLMQFPGTDKATKARAQTTAETLNTLLRQNLSLYEIDVTSQDDNSVISARGTTIVTITPEDAAALKLTTAECAARWRNNISRLFWHETLEGGL